MEPAELNVDFNTFGRSHTAPETGAGKDKRDNPKPLARNPLLVKVSNIAII